MAQHDYDIANADGATVRADINAVLEAIASANVGATAPSVTFPHMIWVDSANNIIKRRNAANTNWINWMALDAAGNLIAINDGIRKDVASAANINLSALSIDSNHINITGTTTVTGFTVTAGRCYFVRFDDQLILTNGAGLVTNTGGNITTRPGASCIIRATAANVVEIIGYSLIETGTNANGRFTKYPDGTLVCEFEEGVTRTTSVVAGSIFSTAAVTFTFAHAFVSPPVVTSSFTRVAGTISHFAGNRSAPTTTTVDLGGYSGTNSGTGTLSYVARGRWY